MVKVTGHVACMKNKKCTQNADLKTPKKATVRKSNRVKMQLNIDD